MKICNVEGCQERHVANGYCRSHNYRFKRYGDPLVVKEIQSKNREKCEVEECGRKHHAKGYCKMHHYRWERYGDPLYKKHRKRVCSVNGCERDAYGKGLCRTHHYRLKANGDPLVVQKLINVPCKIEGCKNKNRKYGYCEKHYYESDLCREQHRIYSANRRSLKENAIVNDFSLFDWKESLRHFNEECAYCGAQDNDLQQEHIIPLSKGGANTISNVVPACEGCNQNKKAKTIEEWYPKQPFYSIEKEMKILKWMGYEINDNKLQIKLF
ncbi:HNH endonuclease [Bacillus badius]|uniref:Phage-associated homing endonuclease n=1 Tax=Bacillus badius TaxID=1455 RepID=A0ABR5AYY9_BACBA|nr:HNH endonuclease [Bacillus badius]KIL79576.1 Phage-associated homing endonuclease [Bacillus badius]MED4716272.1 HNH endonuclease [Bacillus badius]